MARSRRRVRSVSEVAPALGRVGAGKQRSCQCQRSLLETATTLSPAQPLALRSTRAASSASAAARLKVRPGEGGEDAEAFAKALVDAFSAWCRRHRVGFRRADEGRTFVLEVDPAAAGELARFAGVHRVQREPQGTTKRHTSTATVVVISANAGLDAFDEEDVASDRGGAWPGGEELHPQLPAGEVICHGSGRRMPLNRFLRGKF